MPLKRWPPFQYLLNNADPSDQYTQTRSMAPHLAHLSIAFVLSSFLSFYFLLIVQFKDTCLLLNLLSQAVSRPIFTFAKVFFQLPYAAPDHFSADPAPCGLEGPESTPLDRQPEDCKYLQCGSSTFLQTCSRWWFEPIFIFTPTSKGNEPFWLYIKHIFQLGASTTN